MSRPATPFHTVTIDGHTVEYMSIPVSILATDGYQRDLSKAAVAKIADDFDIRLFDPPLVARMPNGEMLVLDGNHRQTGWKNLVGLGTVKDEVVCRVVHVKDKREAADLFIKVNKRRRNLMPFDFWRAACIRGDKDALDIKAAAIDAGVPIERRKRFKSGTSITGVSHLMRIWALTKDDSLLRLTLDILVSAWPESLYGGDKYRTHGFLVEGLAEAIVEVQTSPGLRWNHKQAIKRLAKWSPSDIRSQAMVRAGGLTKATNNPDIYRLVLVSVLTTGRLS